MRGNVLLTGYIIYVHLQWDEEKPLLFFQLRATGTLDLFSGEK